MEQATFAADIKELMAAWDRISDAVRAQFPEADDEQRYQIAKRAMAARLAVREAA